LYSGGKNRRGRGIGLPSRGQGPHLGCPPDRVNSKTSSPPPEPALTHRDRAQACDPFCVREPGAWRRPATSASAGSVSWADDRPTVTVLVRCASVVRGPDVAQGGPSGPELVRRVRSRRPGLMRGPWRRSGRGCDRPLLTVRDRQLPMLRARGGHGRGGPGRLGRGSDGHKLNRRVRPVHDDYLPCWQEPGGVAAA
jgi:hypothetical protein